MTWNGIVYFLRGDDGDYDDFEWDSLINQQFLKVDDGDNDVLEWDSLGNPSIPVQGRIVWELQVY